MDIERKYVPGSNAFDPKRFYKKEVSKRLSYFCDLSKKLPQKLHIVTLYRVSHSEDLRILDLRSISIGFPTVKKCDFWANFFFEIRRSRRSILILLLPLLASDQKNSSRNCIKFADTIVLVLDVDSRGEKTFWYRGHRFKEINTKPLKSDRIS